MWIFPFSYEKYSFKKGFVAFALFIALLCLREIHLNKVSCWPSLHPKLQFTNKYWWKYYAYALSTRFFPLFRNTEQMRFVKWKPILCVYCTLFSYFMCIYRCKVVKRTILDLNELKGSHIHQNFLAILIAITTNADLIQHHYVIKLLLPFNFCICFGNISDLNTFSFSWGEILTFDCIIVVCFICGIVRI